MASPISSTEPIYHALVAEHGDVAAAARHAADEAAREAESALDWSALHGRGPRPVAH
ncbi:hypothetical protein ACQPZG_01095 (plasmid) [Streptomyces sp. CA-294286]|uniref:hypothetical protein n=1 Tax=Streptomyces sp. CA-294286 TaxID=3240070 RepID=UPI003D8E1D61